VPHVPTHIIEGTSPPTADDLSSMLGIDEAREAADAAFESKIADLYHQQKAHAMAEEYEEAAGWVKSQIEGLTLTLTLIGGWLG